MRGFSDLRVRSNPALATLLHHDLLAAAVRETLAHGARLDARLQRQGLARDTQFLVAGSILIDHSAVLILLYAGAPSFDASSLFRVLFHVPGRGSGSLVVIGRPVSD